MANVRQVSPSPGTLNQRPPAQLHNQTSTEEDLSPQAATFMSPSRLIALQRLVGNSVVQRMVAPVRTQSAAPGRIQRELADGKIFAGIKTVLSEHDLEAQYTAWWPDTIKRIKNEINAHADLTQENLPRFVRSHPDIMPLLKNPRLTLITSGDPTAQTSGSQADIVYRAYQELVCYHYSLAADKIRESGLDPNYGGTEDGLSATRSLPGKKAENVNAAKKKVFISRSYTEAKQYAKGGKESDIVRLLVPVDEQAKFEVDPDSQRGMTGVEHLKGAVKADGSLNWWGELFLKKRVDALGGDMFQAAATFKQLYDSGAIAKI
ncbi:MAG: hypothetical protein KME04_20585 [Pleurocapsa minor GSE-CHR-MK-17-07R]|jgi:hypothetical protein|nr:hypothetical protein [Pleurocapsa minor GSE-CHR-MK 17-07R]